MLTQTTTYTAHFEFCDFNNYKHSKYVIDLINHYIDDPMGGGKHLDQIKSAKLIKELSQHPSIFILFIFYNNEIAGLATCFVNYSTFMVAPYINIHDFIIIQRFRKQGLGKLLLNKLINIGKERNYCKLSLEVRYDNYNAQKLYESVGFDNTDPLMHFWTKKI